MPATVPAPSAAPPVAPLGRRVLALFLDWGIASAISAGFFGFDERATLAVFALETWLMLSTLGASIGHAVCGLAVRTLDGRRPGPWRALVRTVALCLVIPAVVWGPGGRGLHDMWAGTTITRVQ
ncbi:RDD family protein [Georgenia sp. TF02-10]|uniref:RDD family protein n=1 Tax=Georgenia sp. TF02-10 TaxID=2917725 RepID=UPI001FA7D10D|nr:RDD family protein [Georgenia sp. TF02-10]UNX53446.1 RDD family protein [Georgenia sp. TF02-10]